MYEEWSDDPQDADMIGCACTRAEGGGLALLSGRYAEQLSVNEDRFEFTRITLEKWGAGGINGLTCFQAWHLLALYHRLDPDSLGLTGPRGNYVFLRHAVKDDPDHVVTQFAQQLDQLKDDIRAGRLLVHKENWSRPEISPTWVAAFLKYIKGRPLISRRAAVPDLDAVVDSGKPLALLCNHTTPQMRELRELSGLFTAAHRDGSYIPGEPETMPDVFAEAIARGIPDRRAQQYHIILCGLSSGGRKRSKERAASKVRRRR